jgi:hypothetical protein
MDQETSKSDDGTLAIVHDSFIEPVRARLKRYSTAIKKSMNDFREYDDILQHVLGGIGAKRPKDSDGDTVIIMLWNTLQKLFGPSCGEIRWVALQPFSNFHAELGDLGGRSMWTPRCIADDYMAKAGRKGQVGLNEENGRIYNQVNSKWYYESSRKRKDHPDRPVGFYNLLMNPRFYKPFQGSDTLQWLPQALLVARSSQSQVGDSILPALNLGGLVGALGGEDKLDTLRQGLVDLVALSGLRSTPFWDDNTDELVDAYQARIAAHFDETKGNGLNDAVEMLKQQLIKVYCNEGSMRTGWGSWSALDGSNLSDAVSQLQTEVTNVALASTFLYWLMQDPKWNFYYYFVFGSTPNTSGPSLGIATETLLTRPLEICISWMLNAFGKDLAMLETQILATERTEARISYFSHLNTHTFTKGFTTPVHNEMARLRGSMKDNFEEEAIARACDRLKRFEYVMQSQEYLGVGAIKPDDPLSYLVEPEAIDAGHLTWMMCQLGQSMKQSVHWRLNDLFDDPRYARKLDASDPAHAINITVKTQTVWEQPRENLLEELRKGGFHADVALLAYHLQSLIQNAAEAIDLTEAAKGSSQRISFTCELDTKNTDQPTLVFSIANSAAPGEETGTRLYELAQKLKTLQDVLCKNEQIDRSQFPPSNKSGGHQGIGLILAAMFCNAIRLYDKQVINRDWPDPKAYGCLLLQPPEGSERLTRFEIRIPLRSTETDVIKIDRRVFRLLPKMPPRDGLMWFVDGRTQPTEGPSPMESIREPEKVRVLVVDDDTADRQRFRFNIRRMLFGRSPEKPPEIDRKLEEGDELTQVGDDLTDNKVFNDNVVFAWDAKAGAVPSHQSITKFLTNVNRPEPITVFLDLAWTREEEGFFDQLRLVSSYDVYRKRIDESKDTPNAFRLLNALTQCNNENTWAAIHIYVVTAYKSANLVRYFKDRHDQLAIDSFMKWSDEARLRGIIIPTLKTA